jgi:hypothetical protein
MITQQKLKELLNYNQDTGIFTWNKRLSSRAGIGDVAGCKNIKGYIYIGIDKVCYKAHRLAWLYVYGYIPKKQIDHINGNPSDNKITNLREVTVYQNALNQKKAKNNTSGIKGISVCKKTNKWHVRITVNGKRKSLGLFDDLDLAELVINEARLKYHGEYANNG